MTAGRSRTADSCDMSGCFHDPTRYLRESALCELACCLSRPVMVGRAHSSRRTRNKQKHADTRAARKARPVRRRARVENARSARVVRSPTRVWRPSCLWGSSRCPRHGRATCGVLPVRRADGASSCKLASDDCAFLPAHKRNRGTTEIEASCIQRMVLCEVVEPSQRYDERGFRKATRGIRNPSV